MSQTEQIRRHLKHGHSLTAGSALRLIGTMRLAARIHDLKRRGVRIKTRMVQLSSGTRVASYELQK